MQNIPDTFLCLQAEFCQPVPSGLCLQGQAIVMQIGVFSDLCEQVPTQGHGLSFSSFPEIWTSWSFTWRWGTLRKYWWDHRKACVRSRPLAHVIEGTVNLGRYWVSWQEVCIWGYSSSLLPQRVEKVPSQLQRPQDCYHYWPICLHLMTWKALCLLGLLWRHGFHCLWHLGSLQKVLKCLIVLTLLYIMLDIEGNFFWNECQVY